MNKNTEKVSGGRTVSIASLIIIAVIIVIGVCAIIYDEDAEELFADTLDFFKCSNCNTIVPIPYDQYDIEKLCPSCGVRMDFISKNITSVQSAFRPTRNIAGSFSQGLGTEGNLICPRCGTVIPHQKGIPSFTVTCPKCGNMMERQYPANIPTAFYRNMTQSLVVRQRNQPLAPPITSGAPMTHEYRGPCSNCHAIVDPVTYSDLLRQGGRRRFP